MVTNMHISNRQHKKMTDIRALSPTYLIFFTPLSLDLRDLQKRWQKDCKIVRSRGADILKGHCVL